MVTMVRVVGHHPARGRSPAQPGGMGSVLGLFGAMPFVGVIVKVTLSAPSGTGVGKCRDAVCSSGMSNGTVPRGVSPAAAVTVPAQPVLPVPQLSWSDTLLSPSGTRAVVVTLSREGNSLPVGVLSPLGSKQPSNS